MDERLSKKRGKFSVIQLHNELKGGASLASYEAACEDFDLECSDTTLEDRSIEAVTILNAGLDAQLISINSLEHVTGDLLDKDEEVLTLFLNCRKDVKKKKNVIDVFDQYIGNSLQTIGFCKNLEDCLDKTRENLLKINLAIIGFEEGLVVKVKYSGIVEELKSLNATWDSFTKTFNEIFKSALNHKVAMSRKLEAREGKLCKRIKSVKRQKLFINFIILAVNVTVLVVSIVEALKVNKRVAAGLTALASLPFLALISWCTLSWNKYGTVLKGEKKVISIMRGGNLKAIKHLGMIQTLVERLDLAITSAVATEFAPKEGEIGISKIKEKLILVSNRIRDVSEQNDKYNKEIRKLRRVVLLDTVKLVI